VNCSKIQSLLSAYMDGELTGEDQLRIREHLDHCHSCCEEHNSLLATKRLISSMTVRQARPEMEQLILNVLAEEESQRVRRSPILAWWLTLPLNRRLQFASLFALGAIALAVTRITPVLLAPPDNQLRTQMMALESPAGRSSLSPVADVSFIHNPVENAPMSVGSQAVPISASEFTDVRTR
jgi:anti-sigma factor RsiW